MGNVVFQKAEFANFKNRSVLRRLDEIPWEAHVQIMKEGEGAAEIAAQTTFPFLVFPCLFDERASAALQRFHQEEVNYWRV